MDKFDWSILSSLERDGRQSFAAIAEQVALSKTPCWTRVQNLERNGTIKGYRAVIDPHAIGLKLTVFVEVTIDFDAHAAFEQAVLEHPAIIECYTTAGRGDYLLQVLSSDVEQLDGLLRHKLCKLPGVQRFSTTVCMKRIKDGGPLTHAAALLNGGSRG
jgi:Lrp/AsnC family leucine-responsive transcriptional regulator